MLRLTLGLTLIVVAVLLGIGNDVLAYERLLVQVLVLATLPAAGVVLVIGGLRALRQRLAEDRLYRASAPERGRLSGFASSLLVPPVLATLVILGLATQNEVEERRHDWPPGEEILHMPRPEVLRLLALGYREFAADLVWLRAVAYFGEHLHTDHQYRWMDKYLDTVIALDPRFRSVYKFAGTVAMYNLRRITKQSVLRSNRYLEKGYRQFPDYWEFPFMICFNYLFELPRYARDAAERRRFRETGAEYCREASLLPGTLYYLPSMAGGVLSKLGERQLARAHFRELILRTEDPKLRKQLQQRYAALASSAAAARLEREAEQFFSDYQGSFPYISPDLFFFVGHRGPPDGIAVVRASLEGG